jgi:hypothetical protein
MDSFVKVSIAAESGDLAVRMLVLTGVVIHSDPDTPADALTVFRAVADADVVCRQRGFVYPPTDRVYAAGLGGIYFSTTVDDVLVHSRTNNGGRHYFECRVPAPTRRIVLTPDNTLDMMRTPMRVDSIVHDVVYGERKCTEYVKAGPSSAVFTPYALTLIRLK